MCKTKITRSSGAYPVRIHNPGGKIKHYNVVGFDRETWKEIHKNMEEAIHANCMTEAIID